MRKALNLIGWLFVSITMIALICTLLSTYLFVRQISYFNTYKTFQICMAVTMAIWAFKMNIDKNERAENMLYSVFCTFIAVGSVFFIYMGVF